MVPAEEKKKKVTKKLVVEETSVPEAPIEAVIKEDLPKEEIEEELKEEEKAEPEKRSVLLPPEEEKEEKTEPEPEEEPSEEKDSKISLIWVVVLALFIIASLVGGGILVFRAGVEKGKLEAGGVSQTAIPTPTPVSSPASEVKRENLKIQVLNGTGKAGVAAAAKEYLEGVGYKNVEIGNADTSDFTETEISIKNSKKDYLEILKSDLSKKYTISETIKTLSEGSEFDTTVTIGSR